MHKRKAQDITPVLQRIGTLVGGSTQVEIANALGVRQSSVSDAKKRGSVPAEWQITLLRRYGVNPDWLLSGEEPKYLTTAESGEIRRAPDISKLGTDSLVNELSRRLSPERDRELIALRAELAEAKVELAGWTAQI